MFSRDDFDCSVIYTWGIDKSKSLIGSGHLTANMARTPLKKWELNSNWLTAGKVFGSILSGRLWEGALRDDTKKGRVAD